MENNKEIYIPPFEYTYFCGVSFKNMSHAYFFGTNIDEIKEGDKVVVETVRGMEVGTVATKPININSYTSKIPLKPILRLATKEDLDNTIANEKIAKEHIPFINSEIKRLKLDMVLLSAEYVLDKSKIIITYVSETRVDFRELLKILASKLKTRIELRQIGSRDKAKMIGGIGICGLTLCCTSFLNEFEGISISRAKNQMLAINIPKLSGHCGKLICCLKYEDDIYTEEKKAFPQIGEKVTLNNTTFRVGSFNIMSKVIRLDSQEDITFVSLEEYNKLPRVR